MALHGNKPIRLTYSNNRIHYPVVTTNGRNAVGGAANSDAAERRRLRLARLRRLRQQRLLRLRSTTTTEATTTTLPPTTTTTTTTVPEAPESTTSWYDSWPLEETQTSAPSGFTDSLDYNYEYKIDDY